MAEEVSFFAESRVIAAYMTTRPLPNLNGPNGEIYSWSGHDWRHEPIAVEDKEDAKIVTAWHRGRGYNSQIEEIPGNAAGESSWGPEFNRLAGWHVIWISLDRPREERRLEREARKAGVMPVRSSGPIPIALSEQIKDERDDQEEKRRQDKLAWAQHRRDRRKAGFKH